MEARGGTYISVDSFYHVIRCWLYFDYQNTEQFMPHSIVDRLNKTGEFDKHQ